ncbi:UNVERIFIED_CONTAM: hypothetical protein HHA_297350 [Hammondia hammondi]|eukprot:XP_008886118.1 hypothetical protein HHA_297350 [Hammondia hammondi]
MVVESKGKAEAELAKSVQATAIVSGAQAEYARKASERQLRSSRRDEEAAATLAVAQAEAESRVAEAELMALEHELGQVEKVNANIEKDEADFNEELLKRRENDADEAETDLSDLKAEGHKIAEAIEKNVKEIDEEEKRADLEVELARLRGEGSAGTSGEEKIQNKLEALERESKIAAEEAAKEELRQKVSEMSAHANENVKRGRNILKAAAESMRAFPTRHPNIAAAEQASLDSIHEVETAATIAQHDVEVEKEQEQTLASGTTEDPTEREQNFGEAPEGEFPALSTSTASVRYGSLRGQANRNSSITTGLVSATVHQIIEPHAVSVQSD